MFEVIVAIWQYYDTIYMILQFKEIKSKMYF